MYDEKPIETDVKSFHAPETGYIERYSCKRSEIHGGGGGGGGGVVI